MGNKKNYEEMWHWKKEKHKVGIRGVWGKEIFFFTIQKKTKGMNEK